MKQAIDDEFWIFDGCGTYHNGKEEILELLQGQNKVLKCYDSPL